MDALAVVVRNDFLNLWNRRKPYRECLVERETTGKPLSYNLSGFFFSSVRRESAERKAKLLASPRNTAGHSAAGPSAHNACVSGCQNREAFNSLHIPSWPKGRFARGKSLQDDRYSTRNGISRVARPVFRNSSNLVVFQSTQKPLHRGFCAHCSPISCNLSSVLCKSLTNF